MAGVRLAPSKGRFGSPDLPDSPTDLPAQAAEAPLDAEPMDAVPPALQFVSNAISQSCLVFLKRLVVAVGNVVEPGIRCPDVQLNLLPVRGWWIVRTGLVGGEDVEMVQAPLFPVPLEGREKKREDLAVIDVRGESAGVADMRSVRQVLVHSPTQSCVQLRDAMSPALKLRL
jgi:hypothetical protein